MRNPAAKPRHTGVPRFYPTASALPWSTAKTLPFSAYKALLSFTNAYLPAVEFGI